MEPIQPLQRTTHDLVVNTSATSTNTSTSTSASTSTASTPLSKPAHLSRHLPMDNASAPAAVHLDLDASSPLSHATTRLCPHEIYHVGLSSIGIGNDHGSSGGGGIGAGKRPGPGPGLGPSTARWIEELMEGHARRDARVGVRAEREAWLMGIGDRARVRARAC